jgi:phosphoribosyl-dephospho-CoA transferase
METKPIEKKYMNQLQIRAQIISQKEMELALLSNERDLYALKIKNEMEIPVDEKWDIDVGEGLFKKVEVAQ